MLQKLLVSTKIHKMQCTCFHLFRMFYKIINCLKIWYFSDCYLRMWWHQQNHRRLTFLLGLYGRVKVYVVKTKIPASLKQNQPELNTIRRWIQWPANHPYSRRKRLLLKGLSCATKCFYRASASQQFFTSPYVFRVNLNVCLLNMASSEGSYDYDFVNDVPDELVCVLCHLALKEAVQMTDCGHRLCKQCFNQLKEYALRRFGKK